MLDEEFLLTKLARLPKQSTLSNAPTACDGPIDSIFLFRIRQNSLLVLFSDARHTRQSPASPDSAAISKLQDDGNTLAAALRSRFAGVNFSVCHTIVTNRRVSTQILLTSNMLLPPRPSSSHRSTKATELKAPDP